MGEQGSSSGKSHPGGVLEGGKSGDGTGATYLCQAQAEPGNVRPGYLLHPTGRMVRRNQCDNLDPTAVRILLRVGASRSADRGSSCCGRWGPPATDNVQ